MGSEKLPSPVFLGGGNNGTEATSRSELVRGHVRHAGPPHVAGEPGVGLDGAHLGVCFCHSPQAPPQQRCCVAACSCHTCTADHSKRCPTVLPCPPARGRLIRRRVGSGFAGAANSRRRLAVARLGPTGVGGGHAAAQQSAHLDTAARPALRTPRTPHSVERTRACHRGCALLRPGAPSAVASEPPPPPHAARRRDRTSTRHFGRPLPGAATAGRTAPNEPTSLHPIPAAAAIDPTRPTPHPPRACRATS